MSQTVKPLDDKEKETPRRRTGRGWMFRILPVLLTGAVVAVALFFAWATRTPMSIPHGHATGPFGPM